MPGIRENVSRMGARRGWECRTTKGRGCGKEYHIKSLPVETQVYFGIPDPHGLIRTTDANKRLKMDLPARRIALNISAAIRNETLPGVMPATMIYLVVKSLQDTFGAKVVAHIIPSIPTIVWDDIDPIEVANEVKNVNEG